MGTAVWGLLLEGLIRVLASWPVMVKKEEQSREGRRGWGLREAEGEGRWRLCLAFGGGDRGNSEEGKSEMKDREMGAKQRKEVRRMEALSGFFSKGKGNEAAV